jgi:OOP family OmpA-OmpF porin
MYRSPTAASLLAASLSLALTTGSAFAQGRGDTGWYLGASIGQSTVDIEGCGGGVDCDDKDTSWRILGGYQLNRNFSIELGFHQFGDASASAPGERVDFEANAFELVGVGYLPMGSNFGLYGKAGFYRGETKASGNTIAFGPIDVKETNTDFTFGLGLQYSFSPQLSIRGEWQRYADVGGGDIEASDVDVMSVGLVVRF